MWKFKINKKNNEKKVKILHNFIYMVNNFKIAELGIPPWLGEWTFSLEYKHT